MTADEERIKVLIAADDPIGGAVLEGLVGRAGDHQRTASDSEHAAVDMLRAGAVNVLVKGASMPEIAVAIRAAARG